MSCPRLVAAAATTVAYWTPSANPGANNRLAAKESLTNDREWSRFITYYAILPLISRADPSSPAVRNTGSGRGGSRSLPLRQVAWTTWRQRYRITSELGVSRIDREHTAHVVFAVGPSGAQGKG